MRSRFDFRCPALHCEFEADSFHELRGHINGKRPHDEYHGQLPPMQKHEFIQY